MVYERESILKTLTYADIFDFPLLKSELWFFLISNKTVTKKSFKKALQNLSAKIVKENGYYCFSNRAAIIRERIKKIKIQEEKRKKAQKIATVLSFLPTIACICLSGSLAVGNAKKDDDIDFFIIAKKNTLWITRLLSFIMLSLMQKRRKRKEKQKDRICLNLFIDEKNLTLPDFLWDLYTAHETVQTLPLVNKNNVYEIFLLKNSWAYGYLPNAKKNLSVTIKTNDARDYSLFLPIEFIAKHLQLWYMRNHRTTEIITNFLLAFHPYDWRGQILSEYKKRLNQYNSV